MKDSKILSSICLFEVKAGCQSFTFYWSSDYSPWVGRGKIGCLLLFPTTRGPQSSSTCWGASPQPLHTRRGYGPRQGTAFHTTPPHGSSPPGAHGQPPGRPLSSSPEQATRALQTRTNIKITSRKVEYHSPLKKSLLYFFSELSSFSGVEFHCVSSSILMFLVMLLLQNLSWIITSIFQRDIAKPEKKYSRSLVSK